LRALASNPPADRRQHFNPDERQKRQVQELVNHIQRLLQLSERVRDEFFWRKAKANDWVAATKEFKTYFWDEVIGRFPPASLPANPRTRKILDKPKWTGYEVALDVWPDVFSWGILLVPKDLKPGERRPVVVICRSGGARMMEGTLSLMQMAKICVTLARLDRERLPYISVLTDPTTGAQNDIERATKIARSMVTEYGMSDLLGPMHRYQSREFVIRAEAMPPFDIIRSATIVNAELLNRAGELGVVAPGARADLIAVDGDPLAEISLLDGQGEHLTHIMKDGVFYKR